MAGFTLLCYFPGISRIRIAALKFGFVCLLLMLSLSSALGRSITLVYDDSDSMTENNKWAYANYAAQSLTALLNDGDSLSVVKMGRPAVQQVEAISPSSQKMRQGNVQTIRNHWRNGAGTPYEAVTSAVENSITLVHGKTKSPGALKQENDWLVIMTDGGFNNLDPNGSGKRDIERLLKEAEGKVRVIFFLIGKKADRDLPKLWQKIMPIDLVESKEEPEEIISSMDRIAALVTGRDTEAVSYTQDVNTPEEINFESPVPIRRLIVFEQKSRGACVRLQKMMIGGNSSDVTLFETDVETPMGKGVEKIVGRVTHAKGNAVLPPGKYSLRFDGQIDKNKLKVFAEAAVDFTVALHSLDGRELKPDTANVYSVCKGDALKIKVRFFQEGTSSSMPLDVLSAMLSASGILDGNKFQFALSPAKDVMEATVTAAGKQQPLSVEARFPGYFHLKSNILTILGKDCSGNTGIQIPSNTNLPLPYIWSDQMVQAAGTTLLITNDAGVGGGHYTITASGIPEGVELRLLGKTLSRGVPAAEIDARHGVPLELTFWRNKLYQESKEFVVKLTASTNQRVTWTKREVDITIQPVARKISASLSGPPWDAPVTDLDRLQAGVLNWEVDGQKISPEEMDRWTIEGKADGFHFGILKVPQAASAEILPKGGWGCDCFRKTGNIPVRIILKGPFPGEQEEIEGRVAVSEARWWDKCKGLIFSVLAGILLLLYLIGVLKKNRFPGSARIVYEEIATGRNRPPVTVWLKGNWFSRYMIPYVPERRYAEGVVFQAGRSGGHVVLQRKTQSILLKNKGDIVFLHNRQLKPPLRDEFLPARQSLLLQTGQREMKYTYQQS